MQKPFVSLLQIFIIPTLLSQIPNSLSAQQSPTEFSIQDNCIISVSKNGAFYIDGSLTSNTDALLNNGEIFITGDITTLSALDIDGEGQVTLMGNNRQQIDGQPITLNTLLLNNSNELILHGDFQVNNELTLVNGRINLNGQTVTIDANGRLSGENDENYIYGSHGHIKMLPSKNLESINSLGLQLNETNSRQSIAIERSHGVEYNQNGDRSATRQFNIITAPSVTGQINGSHLTHELTDDKVYGFAKLKNNSWSSTADEETLNGYYTFFPKKATTITTGEVSISPNPSIAGSTIRLSGIAIDSDQLELTLIDATGKQVHKSVETLHNGNIDVEIPQHLASGIYFVFTNNETVLSTPLMIK